MKIARRKIVLFFLIIGLCFTLYGQPTLIEYTPDPTVDVTPTLYWNSVSGAASYQIQIDDDVSWTTTLVDTIISSALTYFTPISPLPNGFTYWRVSSDSGANFSAVDSFEIKTFPDLVNPSFNPTTDKTPTLSWTSISSATSYRVQIDDAVAFASPDVDTTISGAAMLEAFLPGSDTLGSQTYYWRVASNYDTTAFSNSQAVNYQEVSISRFNDSIVRDSLPNFSWNAYSGATDYRIQVAYDISFATTYVDYYTSGATNYNSSSFGYGKKYWRVSTNHDFNSFCRMDSLKITFSPIQQKFNGDTVYSLRPVFKWNYNDSANSYQIAIDTSKNFNSYTWDGNISQDTSGYTDTTFTPYNKLFEGKWYWRVTKNYEMDSSEIDSFYILDTINRWYVRPGSVNGDGSVGAPFEFVKQAIKEMSKGDTLCISQGLVENDTGYVQADTLDSVVVLGGWDSLFTIRDSRNYETVFDGADSSYYSGRFYCYDNVTIDGVSFKNFPYYALNLESRFKIRISNCSFKNNEKGIYAYQVGDVKILNNIFASNATGIKLYAYSVSDSVNANIINNTFIYNDSSAIRNDSLGVNVRNNIFAFNRKAYQTRGGKLDTLAYNAFYGNDTILFNSWTYDSTHVTDISGLSADTNYVAQNNDTLNPMFVDTAIATMDLHLQMSSACIDTGDPSMDYSLEPAPNGGRINLGAFGGTVWASAAGEIPAIITEPVLDTVNVGDTLIFSVSATGTTPLSYQWLKNGGNISGATLSSLQIDSVVMSDTGVYNVIVFNSFGADTSNSISFKSIRPNVEITPVADTAYLNDTLNFVSSITGTGPITYQWLKDGSPISGATSPTLSIIASDITKGGNYQVIAYNDFGTDTSEIEGLLVIDNIAPDPVTAFTLTEVTCSTVAVSWTQSASADAMDIMIRASLNSMPMHQDSGEYSQLVAVPVLSVTLNGIPPFGAKLFVSSFVKDSSGNWSAYSSSASDTIVLSDGEPPINYIALSIINNGDTAMTLNFDVNDTITSDAEKIIFNMNTDSAQIRFSEQDTFAYKDTTLFRTITEQGNYYISWAPIDSSGNVGQMLSDTFTLQNSLPYFVFGDSATLTEDVEWNLINFVDDYNLDPVKVSLIAGPDALILDTINNEIIWTPLNEDVGSHLLILSADDNIDGAVIDTLVLVVENVNDIPIFQSIVVSDTLIEGSSYTGNAYFKDPDPSESFSFSFSNVSWISSATYTFEDADSLYMVSFDMAPLKGDTGTVAINVIVSDISGASDTITKTIYIMNSNFAPEIKSITLSDTLYEDSIAEGSIEIFDANFEDSLKVVLTGVTWLELNFEVANSDGTKLYKIKGIPEQQDTGISVIKITVVDPEGEIDTITKQVFVVNTNDAPEISMRSKKVSGGAVEYAMIATDDFDTTFTYIGGIKSLEGDVVFIDTNSNGIFEVYPIWDGTYLAHCKVTDKGGLETSVVDTLKISAVMSNTWKATTSWNMVSVPSAYYNIDSAINNEVIQYWDESKPYKNIYQYYNRVSDANLLQSSASYWLKNDGVDISVVIDTASANRNCKQRVSKTIKLSMDSYGWNMISSPYAYPVSWNSDLTLWEWDEQNKEYIDAQNIMYPWKGYWVLAESTGDSVVLESSPIYSTRRSRGISRCCFESFESWQYNVVLNYESGADRENLFGFNINASNGRDRMDRAEPPHLNDAPYLFFTNPQWSGNLREYASDIRKQWSGTEIYNLGISNSGLETKALSIRIDGINEDHKMFLFVRNGDKLKEYNSGDEIEIDPSNEDRYVTLFASSDRNFLSKIPLKFNVAYPYPNPFKGIANLRYTLPYRWENNGLLISKPYHVKIKVYDIRGRVIRELFNGKQKVGIHKVVWDGKVNGGSLASSGAYFIKVSAGDYVTVKKITVLK